MQDFELMDKDNDGGITYRELEKWIEAKALSEGGSWKILISNQEVLKIAHVQASERLQQTSPQTGQKVFGIDDFRIFLIQLFAISVLFVHFKNADNAPSSYDFGNMLLSREEFKMAVHTLTGSHEGEHVSDEQIQADFDRMDTDKSNSLSFLEVCSYCCTYLFTEESPVSPSSNIPSTDGALTAAQLEEIQAQEDLQKAARLFGDVSNRSSAVSTKTLDLLESDADGERSTPKRRRSHFSSVKERNTQAVDSLQEELERNKSSAKMVEARQGAEDAIAALLA